MTERWIKAKDIKVGWELHHLGVWCKVEKIDVSPIGTILVFTLKDPSGPTFEIHSYKLTTWKVRSHA